MATPRIVWFTTRSSVMAMAFAAWGACSGPTMPRSPGAADEPDVDAGQAPDPIRPAEGASSGGGGILGSGGAAGSGGKAGSGGASGMTGSGGAMMMASMGGQPGAGGSPLVGRGGSSGSGGSSGMGGAPAMRDAGSTTKPPVGGSATGSGCSDKIEMENMIADFEDGTNGILPVGGRGAGFYVYDDGSGKQMAAPSGPMGGACASMYAYRSVGAGYSKWGAGIGTDLVAGAMKQSFNASAYSGIRFMARAGSAVMVRFKAQDKNTIPEGGVCKPGGCNNNFGKIVSVGTDWKSYTVLFKDMTQEDWGDIFPAFEKDKIYGLQFQFAKGVDFDLSIDNVAFVK